ncbi:MAG: PA14 domain-containing protein [Chloroflexota bacterium]
MWHQTLSQRNVLFILALSLMALLLVTLEAPVQAQADDSFWQATYWNNRFLTGAPALQRQEANIDYNWGGGSPDPAVQADDFSARWVRSIYLPMGHYRFTATSDDGMRVWVDDTLLIDNWQEGDVRSLSADVTLLAGDHQIKVEYYEADGSATAQLSRQLLSGYDTNWLARYYDNMTLSGEPVLVQHVPQINFSLMGAPVSEVGADNFSIQWTRDVDLEAGRYRFSMTADDGARLWVNNQLVIAAWQDQAATTYTVEVNIDDGGLVPVRMEYYDNRGDAVANLEWTRITAVSSPPASPTGTWRGEYYNNVTLSGTPAMVRDDAQINFNWAEGSPAPALMGPDRFSVRWTRTLDLSPGRYEITAYADDGVRLWLDNELRLDQWQVQPTTASSTVIDHSGGPLPVVVEYFENSGLAEIRLFWTQTSSESLPDSAVPTAAMTGALYLNVRSGPGLNYEPFSSLRNGQTVPLVGRDQTAVWVQIVLPDNTTGWVSSRYLVSGTPFVELPVVNP